MLQTLAQLADGGDFFNLFRYITFRAIGAMITALLIGFAFGPAFIGQLRRLQANGQPIRDDGPQSHLETKAGTPTMGGMLILASLAISTLLWARLDNPYIWIVLLSTVAFGIIGFVDDWLKVVTGHPKGLSMRLRLGIGLTIGGVAGAVAMVVHPDPLSGMIALPIWKDHLINVGLVFIPFSMLVIAGSANAVNLTDGLDGLAIMPVMMAAATLGIIAYAVGRVDFTDYLDVHYVPGTGELLVFAAALVGAGLGFLWYNAPPAAVFMGDTGSLALGAAVGAIATAIKHELVLVIVGGVFVVEAASVILQVGYFKLTRRRIFLMAPIHHHFEKKGWAESQIVIRFWIIALILALIGLASLKVR